MSLRSLLRAETSDCHEQVDAIFGQFDLADPLRYAAFLQAHARAVPAVELALEAAGIEALMADWPERRRRERLYRDLAALNVGRPAPLPMPALKGAASLWGAAYVLEGSKLGGAMLAKAVPPGLPRDYLDPFGPKGGMRSFMDRLDGASLADPQQAVAAARAVFLLFRRAAEIERELAIP